ncbi:phospholipase D family protein [Coraliomargarita parva]|uniref:phospholipase D family protein n=1 Tax=Coraliomargarita parva TaxID=3014050 RepID=UPI0022B4C299|nr:phospholipase D family protein [Coraliomargarita parva]
MRLFKLHSSGQGLISTTHWIVLPLLWLPCLFIGCASVPEREGGEESSVWDRPEQTELGRRFATPETATAGTSGVFLLPDSRDAFRVRYAAAAKAEKTIDLQYYLWKGDATGNLLLDRVLKKADEGVRVRILIDDIYHSGRDQVYASLAQHPKVEVRVFNPIGNRGIFRNLGFALHSGRYNYRMHNKIFLVDGALAVMGGRNIGDDYFGVDPELNFHDLDVLAVGPAAQEAGQAFDLFWNAPAAVPIEAIVPASKVAQSHEELRRVVYSALERYIDEVPYRIPVDHEAVNAGIEWIYSRLSWAPVRVVVDAPDRFDSRGESAIFNLMKELSPTIDSELYLQTAYLLPEAETIAAMGRLVKRGVDVNVMTNSLLSNNHLAVHAHYRKVRKKLLRAGVDLYELKANDALTRYYRNTDQHVASSHSGLHTKAFVMDHDTSVIGSYNMDPRSRVWNSEIALVIEDEKTGLAMKRIMSEAMQLENAYELHVDASGQLTWTTEDSVGASEVFTREPGASLGQRFLSRIIGWIPVRGQL